MSLAKNEDFGTNAGGTTNSGKIFRFFYLNLYAFFLLGLGIVIVIIPLNILIIILKYLLVMWCIIGAFAILAKYKIKIRQLIILKKRNGKEIRPDTFKIHLKTPCGKLLVSKVLAELKKSDQYANITKNEWDRIEGIVYRKKSKLMIESKKEV
jgi:hypothetical protein